MVKVEDMMTPADDHPCIIKSRNDPEMREDFHWVQCACHDGNEWRAWLEGDPAIKCRGDND